MAVWLGTSPSPLWSLFPTSLTWAGWGRWEKADCWGPLLHSALHYTCPSALGPHGLRLCAQQTTAWAFGLVSSHPGPLELPVTVLLSSCDYEPFLWAQTSFESVLGGKCRLHSPQWEGIPFLDWMNDALSVAQKSGLDYLILVPSKLSSWNLCLWPQVTEHLVVLLDSNGRTTQQSSPLSSSFWPRLDAPDNDGW